MEVNQIFNRNLKNQIGNAAIGILLENELIKEDELYSVGLNVGYMFTTEEDELEALFSITCSEKVFFFAVQHDRLMLINIDQAMFDQTLSDMEKYHPCILESEIPETPVQKERREKNNRFLEQNNITVSKTMPCLYEDEEVTIKNTEEIAKRAAACLLCVQIACDIANNDYKESVEFFKPILEKYGVADCINSNESRILDGSYSTQDAIDMDWAYEAYWALCWCLGFVDDISDGSKLCDCDAAISFLMNSNSMKDFIDNCSIRSKQEILDMHDLYYRCQWAINDNKVNPGSSKGELDPSVVIERRRALEWVLSDENDWYDIELDA